MIVTQITREEIDVSTSAIGCDNGGTLFTEAVKRRLIYANVQVQAQQVRATFDGSTAPVGQDVGEVWNPGDLKRLWGQENIENIQWIRDTADAKLEVTYWGEKA